ncbi:prephenate dehydratase domain-containing protein [Leptospira licerasiae]|uniref:prephenate dehydratase domain-containing protein n=1 Tax=Leptospira licerasiae TaxID=447106 RepID=UPI00108443F2|nr:prephenate dehydratase domain-containing protein [Leptospira licerasiae]TGM87904.1 hypothetical protein EHR05_14710 [Leptospira licerasiae]
MNLLRFQGAQSQTGIALSNSFPGCNVDSDVRTFEEIWDLIEDESKEVLVPLPAWNSYVGEIGISKCLNLVFEEKCRIVSAFANYINFVLVSRVEKPKSVVGVKVCAKQCSAVIAEKDLKFIPVNGSDDAKNEFISNKDIEAIFCTKDQLPLVEKGNLCIAQNAENNFNFTVFLIVSNSPEIVANNLKSKLGIESEVNFIYQYQSLIITGGRAKIEGTILNYYRKYIENHSNIKNFNFKNLPTLLFVSERQEDRIGLLFQVPKDNAIDIEIDRELEEDFENVKKFIFDRGEDFNSNYEIISKEIKKHYEINNKTGVFELKSEKPCLFYSESFEQVLFGFDYELTKGIFKGILRSLAFISMEFELDLISNETMKIYKDDHFESLPFDSIDIIKRKVIS